MKISELKKTKPATMKSSGTDDPKKYVGKWETYDEPQGINDRQDPKVLAMEGDGTSLSDKVQELGDALGLSTDASTDDITALGSALGLKPIKKSGKQSIYPTDHHPGVGDNIIHLKMDEDFSGLGQLFNESSYGPSGLTRFGPEKDSLNIIIDPADVKAIRQSRKAPKKQVRKSAMALSARGKKPVLSPRKKQIKETIRTPVLGTLNNEYEIIDGDENTIGFAKVKDGVIDTFDFITSAAEAYRGQIINAMLSQIVNEADRHKANLSIQLTDVSGDLKYIFERYGFRDVGKSIMKRNTGSIRPTSVATTGGMGNSLTETALERHGMIMGLSQWVNDDIGLVGGGKVGGGSDAGETRLRYDIYDMIDIDMKQAEKNKVGFVDLNVRDSDNQIVGLVNIEITQRLGGIGRRVIDAILDTTGELKIYDIKKSAKPFWTKMGIEYTTDGEIGALNGVIRR